MSITEGHERKRRMNTKCKKKLAKPPYGTLTPEIPVVLLATLPLTVLGLRSPVSHAAQLVAFGEGSVGHTTEHVVARGGGTPRVFSWQGSHQVCDRSRSHFGYVIEHRQRRMVGVDVGSGLSAGVFCVARRGWCGTATSRAYHCSVLESDNNEKYGKGHLGLVVILGSI